MNVDVKVKSNFIYNRQKNCILDDASILENLDVIAVVYLCFIYFCFEKLMMYQFIQKKTRRKKFFKEKKS